MSGRASNVVPMHKPGEEPDAQLVLSAIDGERWAKEALFRRHARRLLGLAYRLMPEQDPEDLVQDAFILGFAKLHTLANPRAFGPWMSAVLVSLVRGRLRKQRWLKRLGMVDAEALELRSVVSADAPVDVREKLEDVYRGLKRMSDEQRIAVVLQRIEGLELDEVAEQMGLSVATVKRRVVEADRVLDEVKSHG